MLSFIGEFISALMSCLIRRNLLHRVSDLHSTMVNYVQSNYRDRPPAMSADFQLSLIQANIRIELAVIEINLNFKE